MKRLKQLEEVLSNLRNNISDDEYLERNYTSIQELAMDIIEVCGRIEELKLKGEKE